MNRAREYALQDEREHTFDERPWWTGRPALPGALAQGYARLRASPPARRYDLSIPYHVIQGATMRGEVCIKGAARVGRVSDLRPEKPVTVMEAAEIGIPRRHMLRVAELFMDGAPELLRLYAADCAELVRDVAGDAHRDTLHTMIDTARRVALGEIGREALPFARAVLPLGVSGEVGDVYECARLALADDPAEAAQGGNLKANQIGRRLTQRTVSTPGEVARMTGDIDRVLTYLLTRYDWTAV